MIDATLRLIYTHDGDNNSIYCHQVTRYLTEEDLKVVWAEFSTKLGRIVILHTKCMP